MKSDTLRVLLHQVAREGIPDSYEGWSAIRTRLNTKRRTTTVQWRWAMAVVIAVAVLGASAAFVATSMPEPVSAEALVDRASAVSDGLGTTVRSYHITATNTLKPADSTAASTVEREETWYGGPGRMRQETHSSDWSSITVNNGQQAWWSVTRDGHTYVAPANGIRFSDTALLNPLAPEGTSMSSILAFLGQKGCGTFRLDRDQTLAGRDAYVVSATHTLQSMLDHQYGCASPVELLAAPSPSPAAGTNPAAEATQVARVAEKRALAASGQPGPGKSPAQIAAAPSPSPAGSQPGKPAESAQPSEVQRLLSTTVVDTFWIDKQTFVPLKAEQSLGPKGTSQYEVTSVEFDITIPESVFQFTPASDARMLQDPAAIKQILAGR